MLENDGLENLTSPSSSTLANNDTNNIDIEPLETLATTTTITEPQFATNLVDEAQIQELSSPHNQETLTISISEDTINSSPSYTTAENATPDTSHHAADIENSQEQVETTTKLEPTDGKESKKTVLFDTVTVYHFTRSQGFSSIPSQGGSTLGMKRRHFLRRKLSVDLYEEVRRRSRREILLKIRLDKRKKKEECDQLHCHSVSSSTSSTSNTTTSSSSDTDDEESYSDYSDISDAELESDSYIFLQPIGVRLRRSLLRASGVGRIDPKEKKDCKFIRESRERSGCKCVDQCVPGLCDCILQGINCHVERTKHGISFPCGCVSGGPQNPIGPQNPKPFCQNPFGRTEFDIKRVKVHLFEILDKQGIG